MAIRRQGVVQTKLEVEGERKYQRDMDAAKRSLDNFAGGAKGASTALAGMGPVGAVAAAGIGVAVVAMEAAIAVGRTAISVYGELGERGGAFAAVAGYYEQIGSQETLARLQRLSGWHVRQLAIMQSYNQVMEVGLVSQQEFEEWFQRTISAVQTTGREITQTWEQVATALRGGGTEVLTGLGINIQEVNAQLRAMGLSAETVEGRSAALRLALEQLRDITGEADNSASNLSDTWEATTVQAGDFYDEVARIVSTSPAAIASFEAMREKLFGIDGAAGAAGEGIAKMAQITIRSLALGVIWTSRFLEGMGSAWAALYSILPMGEDIQRRFENIVAAAGEARGIAQAAFEAAAAPAVAAAGAGAQRPIVPGIPGAGRAPRAARAREEAEIQFEILDITEMHAEALGRIDELTRGITETEQLYLDIIGTQTELEQERAQAEEERARAQMERLEQIAEAHQRVKEEEEAAAQAAIEAAAQRQAQLIENFDTISQTATTLGNIFGMIAQQQEAAGKASDQWRKAEGVALGIFYTIKTIGATAEAIGSFASLNIVGGLAYTAQAVQYGIAAGMAFSQLAQGAGGAGAGAGAARASAGSFVPARREPVGAGAPTPAGGNTYNIFTMGGGDFARQVRRADYTLQRSGTFAQVPGRGVRFTG